MEILSIILLAICYGITMKIADLLNEHGLKWFKGSALIFGILWGLFGAALVLTDTAVAIVILAMNLAFLVRNRLDYFNHQVAATIIIVSYLLTQTFMPMLFGIFFAIFAIFGSLKDYVDDKLRKKGPIMWITESGWYYPIPGLIYSIMTNNWSVFVMTFFYVLSYNIVKYMATKKGYK